MKKTAKILRWTSIFMAVAGIAVLYAIAMRCASGGTNFPEFIRVPICFVAPFYPYFVAGMFALSIVLDLVRWYRNWQTKRAA